MPHYCLPTLPCTQAMEHAKTRWYVQDATPLSSQHCKVRNSPPTCSLSSSQGWFQCSSLSHFSPSYFPHILTCELTSNSQRKQKPQGRNSLTPYHHNCFHNCPFLFLYYIFSLPGWVNGCLDTLGFISFCLVLSRLPSLSSIFNLFSTIIFISLRD